MAPRHGGGCRTPRRLRFQRRALPRGRTARAPLRLRRLASRARDAGPSLARNEDRRASAGGTGSVDEIAKVIELLETGRHGEPRRIQLRGRPLAAIAAAVRVIAREARLRGFIPVSTACLALGNDETGGTDGGCAGPTAQGTTRAGHSRSGRPTRGEGHGCDSPAPRAGDGKLSATHSALRRRALIISRNGDSRERRGRTVRNQSRRSSDSPPAHDRGRRILAIGRGLREGAGESRAHYGAVGAPSSEVGGDGLPDAEATPMPCRFPALGRAGDSRVALERARSRSVEGMSLAKRGRHAAGERLLREAAGALARRGDEAWAGRTALDLGRLLHWRGRVREAARAFEQARTLFDRCSLQRRRSARRLTPAWCGRTARGCWTRRPRCARL